MRVRVMEYIVSIGFAQKGPVKEFDFWNVFGEGFEGIRFFECSSYQEPTVFMNLQKFALEI